MTLRQKALTFLIGLAVGAVTGYVFFGGLFRDEFGDPTAATALSDCLICGSAGLVCGFAYIKIRTASIREKRLRKLKLQFKDLLEAVNTALGAGNNVMNSFSAAYNDLKVQYDESAFINEELRVILSGIVNNADIEELLSDFGERSGIDDIRTFANVFEICYRKGGNIKDTVRGTQEILSDKINIREEIETAVTANKTEQNIMVFMPIAIIAMIKLISPDFTANFRTIPGIAATFLGIALFVAAYFVGKAVLNIKI
jgi:tight adherence protein B